MYLIFMVVALLMSSFMFLGGIMMIESFWLLAIDNHNKDMVDIIIYSVEAVLLTVVAFYLSKWLYKMGREME